MRKQFMNTINTPIFIQDIIARGIPTCTKPPVGEFGNLSADEKTQTSRLYLIIKNLIEDAAFEHKKMNCNGNTLRSNKENNITRLITNEFSFYTKTPLSIAEFNQLQQKILLLAKQQPKNLHLVLSSFAVRTPDNKIMNVVAQIECGQSPQVHYVVKNNPSGIDPVYSERIGGRRQQLANIDIKKGDRVDQHSVVLDGKNYRFSFNNVIECKTSGGVKFNTCIDICLDHNMGVAKNYLNQKINTAVSRFLSGGQSELFATQCSHIVTSNHTNVEGRHSLGAVTHVDPYVSNGKSYASILDQYVIHPNFGTSFKLKVTSPTACSKLPDAELAQISAYNNMVANYYKTYYQQYTPHYSPGTHYSPRAHYNPAADYNPAAHYSPTPHSRPMTNNNRASYGSPTAHRRSVAHETHYNKPMSHHAASNHVNNFAPAYTHHRVKSNSGYAGHRFAPYSSIKNEARTGVKAH